MKFVGLLITLLVYVQTFGQVDTAAQYKKDVSSVDYIIAAMYDVISGPAGPRDWNRFHNLYHPNSYMMAIFATSDSTFSCKSFTPKEYVERSDEVMKKFAFKEIELKRRTEQYGNLVNIFSAYEFTTPIIVKSGINSLQLYFDGTRWWIMSIIWQESSPTLPLPSWVR